MFPKADFPLTINQLKNTIKIDLIRLLFYLIMK